jgi:hypothetical protein
MNSFLQTFFTQNHSVYHRSWPISDAKSQNEFLWNFFGFRLWILMTSWTNSEFDNICITTSCFRFLLFSYIVIYYLPIGTETFRFLIDDRPTILLVVSLIFDRFIILFRLFLFFVFVIFIQFFSVPLNVWFRSVNLELERFTQLFKCCMNIDWS